MAASLLDPRVFGASPVGLRRERVQASPRFRHGRFENTVPLRGELRDSSFGERMTIFGEFFFGGSKRKPPGVLPVESPLAAWSRPVETGLRTTWLGHSTVLVELGGRTVLTDPVFGNRASPFSWAGPARFHRPPASIAQLPRLDVVLISHDHYDHLDFPSIEELLRRPDAPLFVTSLGVGAHLEAWGVPAARIHEMDWWESVTLFGGDLIITATPSRHFSGRGTGKNQTAWSSWVVRSATHSVFFSGDTGLTPEFEDIRRSFSEPFDVVMLEVGAHHPAWGEIHLGPDNALEAHRMLGGKTLLPVHWGTFDLGLHAWIDPIERLARGAVSTGAHLVTPRLGRVIEPSRVETVDPWWESVRPAGLEPSLEGNPAQALRGT